MITLAIGCGILPFLVMFWLEDRYGGGVYDPDPSADFRHRKNKSRNLK